MPFPLMCMHYLVSTQLWLVQHYNHQVKFTDLNFDYKKADLW